jgi:hypothetical protein
MKYQKICKEDTQYFLVETERQTDVLIYPNNTHPMRNKQQDML